MTGIYLLAYARLAADILLSAAALYLLYMAVRRD